MIDFTTARANMVDSQVRPNGITDSRIIEAMLSVQRERFLPAERAATAYVDENIPLAASEGPRFQLEPMTFARMLQLALIAPEHHVLVVGAGTGYGAAVVSELAARVTAVEQDETLAAQARINLQDRANVELHQGPLVAGWQAAAPYDVIIIEGGVEIVPDTLYSQLRINHRLIASWGEVRLPNSAFGL